MDFGALANERFWKGPCAGVVEVLKVVLMSLRTLKVDVSSCQIGDLVDSAREDGYKCPRGDSETSNPNWCSFYSCFFFCYLILHLWYDRPRACRKDNRYPPHLEPDPVNLYPLQMPTAWYLIACTKPLVFRTMPLNDVQIPRDQPPPDPSIPRFPAAVYIIPANPSPPYPSTTP